MSKLKMIHLSPGTAPTPQPPPGFTLRGSRETDWEDLVRLYAEGDLGITNVDGLHRKLLSHQSYRAERVRVVEHEGRVVGTVAAFVDRVDATQGFLHLLAVDPSMRGRGLGRLLVVDGLSQCSQDGCRQQWLLTDAWRVGPIKLYLQLGFRPVYVDDEHRTHWERLRGEMSGSINWESLSPDES